MVAPVNINSAGKACSSRSIKSTIFIVIIIIIDRPENLAKLIGLRLNEEVPLIIATAFQVRRAIEVGWSEGVRSILFFTTIIGNSDSMECGVHTANLCSIKSEVLVKEIHQVPGCHISMTTLARINLHPVALIIVISFKNSTCLATIGHGLSKVDIAKAILALVVVVIVALSEESAFHTAVPHAMQFHGGGISIGLVVNNVGVATNAIEKAQIVVATTVSPFKVACLTLIGCMRVSNTIVKEDVTCICDIIVRQVGKINRVSLIVIANLCHLNTWPRSNWITILVPNVAINVTVAPSLDIGVVNIIAITLG